MGGRHGVESVAGMGRNTHDEGVSTNPGNSMVWWITLRWMSRGRRTGVRRRALQTSKYPPTHDAKTVLWRNVDGNDPTHTNNDTKNNMNMKSSAEVLLRSEVDRSGG